MPFTARPCPPGYGVFSKPLNLINQSANRGSSSFTRTFQYQFSALIVLRYAHTRGMEPGTPGSAAYTASACAVMSSSEDMGCAFAHSAFAFDQSYTMTPYLLAASTLCMPELLHV